MDVLPCMEPYLPVTHALIFTGRAAAVPLPYNQSLNDPFPILIPYFPKKLSSLMSECYSVPGSFPIF